MVNYAQLFQDLMRSDNGSGNESSSRRGTFGTLSGVSAARLKNLFEIVYRKNSKAAGNVLYKSFRAEVERRLKVRVDYYLEERLWAIVEARLDESRTG